MLQERAQNSVSELGMEEDENTTLHLMWDVTQLSKIKVTV